MTTQPEQILENNLVTQLVALGYKKVEIVDEVSMLSNLKEKFLLFQLSVVLEVFHELDLITFKIK